MSKNPEHPKRRIRPKRKVGGGSILARNNESVLPESEPLLSPSLDESAPANPPIEVTVVTKTTVKLSPTAQVAFVLRDNPDLVLKTISEMLESPDVLMTLLTGLSHEPGLIPILPEAFQKFLHTILNQPGQEF